MIKRTNHINILPFGKAWLGFTTLLLTVCTISNAQVYLQPDTIDEDAYLSHRDTVKMSRLNVALSRGDKNYGTDYVIDDNYLVSNEQFSHGLLSNIYLGGGVGFDFLQPRTDDFSSLMLSQMSLSMGKQLTPVHSLRLSLGAAVSYLSDRERYFFRGTTKLDYLYDLSTHISGYKAARPLSISLLAGIGASLVNKDESWSMRLVPDLHAGMQFRIYTGPRCYFNIEPYASISTDQLDHTSSANWRKYDVSYGINLNMMYYLDDQLSSQSKLRLLQARDSSSLMVDKKTVSTWRTPWFFEAASGMAFGNVNSEGLSMGNATSLAVGRWFSPVIGVRLAAATRSVQSLHLNAGASYSGYDERYYSHYNSGRIDFLINPIGFTKGFSWDSRYGGYLVLGTELGAAHYHDDNGERQSYFAQTFSAGIHLWTKLTDDLHFFIEPRYSHNTYTRNTDGAYKFCDNIPTLNIGLTVLTRSQKFHELDEFDKVQNFMHSYVRGFRLGITGGLSVFHPRYASYGGNAHWMASAYLEYRFSHLHSVRAAMEYMSNRRNDIGDAGISLVKTNSIIASLDYEISMTNLLSGILRHRWCELEAFVGPSAEFTLSTSNSVQPTSKSPMFGVNGGLKLSKHIWNGISVVAIPTLYLIDGTAPQSINTVSAGGFHYYQSFSLGVQYKIGSLHRNASKVRAARLRADQRWSERQQRKLLKQQQKNQQ